jgi:hypothetical protein
MRCTKSAEMQLVVSAKTHSSGLLGGDLRREEADPDLRHLVAGRPEADELFEVAVALHLLAGDGAVHRDLVPGDVLLNAIVGRRRAPHVVFGLQAIDRHHDLQTPDLCELGRNRTHRAGHQLRVDAAVGEQRQDLLQFAIAHQRLAADDRHV